MFPNADDYPDNTPVRPGKGADVPDKSPDNSPPIHPKVARTQPITAERGRLPR